MQRTTTAQFAEDSIQNEDAKNTPNGFRVNRNFSSFANDKTDKTIIKSISRNKGSLMMKDRPGTTVGQTNPKKGNFAINNIKN